jgi:hypothetical protein
MTTKEEIENELASAPDTLLNDVLSFIRDNKNMLPKSSDFKRIANLHGGQVWMSDDFNDALPDQFWLGEEE